MKERGWIGRVLGFSLLGILPTIFCGFMFFTMHREFDDFGRFRSDACFFLDGGKYVAAIGQEELSEDRMMYLRVYDAQTHEMVREAQDLRGDDIFIYNQEAIVLRQGGQTLLLDASDELLYLYSIDEAGTVSDLNGGNAFWLTDLGGFGAPVWQVMENALFSARDGEDTILGLVQDGRIHTLNLSRDARLSVGIQAIHPGPATLSVDLADGQRVYIGQFLLDGEIPVVTESERRDLYARYADLYWGGRALVNRQRMFGDPSAEPHEVVVPLGGLGGWAGIGQPYGMGSSAYREDDDYYCHVLPYGYTLVRNLDWEDITTLCLLDTWTGEMRVDLLEPVALYGGQIVLEADSLGNFFLGPCAVVRGADGSDALYADGAALYRNLDTGETRIFTGADVDAIYQAWYYSLDGYIDYAGKEGAIPVLIAFGFLLIAVLGVVRGGFTSAARAIKKHGAKIVSATIFSLERTSVTINDNPLCRLQLRFTWEGRMMEKQINMTVDLLSPVQVGESILILYDPVKDKVRQLPRHLAPSGEARLLSCRVDDIAETGYRNAHSRLVILHAESEQGERVLVPAVEWKEIPYRRDEWVQLRVGDPGNITLMKRSTRNVFPPDEGQEPVLIHATVMAVHETGWVAGQQRLLGYDLYVTELSCPMLLMSLSQSYAVLSPGAPVQTAISRKYYDRLRRMAGKPQGAATVLSVEFGNAETGIRRFKRAEIEVSGQKGVFYLNETIEDYYGLQAGDALWVSYDVATREALIQRYAE